MEQSLRVAVVGFGWMGQTHSQSLMRMPTLFPDAPYRAELAVCVDADPARLILATESYGFADATDDWAAAVSRDDIDVVFVCAPNMLHEPVVTAAAAAGHHVFCEKPVGGTPAQTVRMHAAAAHLTTGVGYNYRFAPLVVHAKALIDGGELGTVTNYRGRFFSMFGNDPLGLLTWRFKLAEGGHGVSSDILSHAIDLGMMLNGPITSVVGTGQTFVTERPLATGAASHYAVGSPDDPTGAVENEDYFGALVTFANGSSGTFEVSRTAFGPQSQMAFDVYGTDGALAWNHETMNELDVWIRDRHRTDTGGYTTVRAGEAHPHHMAFVPGEANSIGFSDLVAIEDHEFLCAVAAGEPHSAGFDQALAYVSVQAALLRSWVNRRWEDVVTLTLANVDDLVPDLAVSEPS